MTRTDNAPGVGLWYQSGGEDERGQQREAHAGYLVGGTKH